METEDIIAPLFLNKIPSILFFYKKVKELNSNANPDKIFAFIKKHEYICRETVEDFEHNWALNMFYISAPLYLDGYKYSKVKKKLYEMQKLLLLEIQDNNYDTFQCMNELLNYLLNKLSTAQDS